MHLNLGTLPGNCFSVYQYSRVSISLRSYIHITNDGLLKLQWSAQLEEQYNNNDVRNNCVCVYALSPAGFFRLQDVCDILEMFGSMIFCCEHCWGLLPSSCISVSENVIFHLQRRKLQPATY